jgi:hypothetical protein
MTEVLKTTALTTALLRDLARQKHPHQALGDIAGRHGLTFDQAFDIVAAHGYPDPTAMRKAADTLAVASPSQGRIADPEPVEQLLRKGEKSTKQRTRKAAARARVLLAELNQAVQAEDRDAKARKAAEQERAWLQAEVDKLEKQLAEKKTALKTTASRGKPATAPKHSTSDSQAIRAWAAEAGIDCPARGRIPGRVRELYEAAMPVPTNTAGAA